ncbi:GPI ethanolamine phosphate transferase 2 [Eumeta japonica]|uniref:GPI ethanolamine phosphate transferase 2 n=1 Tax=Eumeta variegata TaxID=151549 RepID=A0A4C1TI46_EUMVA|nr:GPI ethanolamine phosphate transferase 2 [Eumeta japonica]
MKTWDSVHIVNVFWVLLIAQMIFELLTFIGIFRKCRGKIKYGNPDCQPVENNAFVYNKPKAKTEDYVFTEYNEPWNGDEVKLRLIRSVSHLVLNDMMLIIILLMRPHNVIMVPSCYITCVLTSKCMDHSLLDRRPGRRTDILDVLSQSLVHFWIGYLFFFYQGNSNSLSSVDLGAGYVGLREYCPVRVSMRMGIHTYAGPALAGMTLFCSIAARAKDLQHYFQSAWRCTNVLALLRTKLELVYPSPQEEVMTTRSIISRDEDCVGMSYFPPVVVPDNIRARGRAGGNVLTEDGKRTVYYQVVNLNGMSLSEVSIEAKLFCLRGPFRREAVGGRRRRRRLAPPLLTSVTRSKICQNGKISFIASCNAHDNPILLHLPPPKKCTRNRTPIIIKEPFSHLNRSPPITYRDAPTTGYIHMGPTCVGVSVTFCAEMIPLKNRPVTRRQCPRVWSGGARPSCRSPSANDIPKRVIVLRNSAPRAHEGLGERFAFFTSSSQERIKIAGFEG